MVELKATRFTKMQRISEAAVRARQRNVAANPLSNVATITESGTAPVGLTQVIARNNLDKILPIGGLPFVNGNDLFLWAATVTTGNTGAGGNGRRQQQIAYEILTDAPTICFSGYTALEFLYRVAAGTSPEDMAYLQAGPATFGANGATRHVLVEFGSRQLRRVRFEVGCNGYTLANIHVTPGSTIVKPNDPEPLTAMLLGDSFDCTGAGGSSFNGSIAGTTLTVTGTPTATIAVGQTLNGVGVAPGQTITALGSGTGGAGTYTVAISQTVSATTMRSGNAWGHQSAGSLLCFEMGWRCWPSAVGGTGFYRTNGNLDYADRSAIDGSIMSADLAVIRASINDKGVSPVSLIQAKAQTTFANVRSALGPDKPIFVLGVSPCAYGPDAQTIALEQATVDAVAAYVAATNDHLIFMIPIATLTTPWITGTGKIGTPSGTGNSDFYTSVDAIHPEPVIGAKFLASISADAIRAKLAQYLAAA